jgi:hypothetical protein
MNARSVIETWPGLADGASPAALQARPDSRASGTRSTLIQVDLGDGTAVDARSGGASVRSVRSATEARRSGPPTVPLRHIFLLVNEFRAQCQQKAEPHRLGAVLNAVIQLARHGFSMVEELRGADARFVAENKRCLVDLEELLGALLGDNAPPAHELFHAMDPLIVQFVRIDAVTRSGRRGRRAAPSRPSSD